MTLGLNSTLNCGPRSWFHDKLWLGVGYNSKGNSDPGSQLNVELRPGSLNSTWNSDPSTYLLPVDIATQEVFKINSELKIQQPRRVIIKWKIHWILIGSVFNWGQNFILHRRLNTPTDRRTGQVFYHSPLESWWGILFKLLKRY